MFAENLTPIFDALQVQNLCNYYGEKIKAISLVTLDGGQPVAMVQKVTQGHRCQDDKAVIWLQFASRNDVERFQEIVASYDKSPKRSLTVSNGPDGDELRALKLLRSDRIIFHHSSPKVA